MRVFLGLSMVVMIVAAGSISAQAAASNSKYAGIVVDAKSGNVLYSENADRLQYPASLTKMMTLYLVFEALEAKRIRLDSVVPFSSHASAQPPTKLGVKPGNSITVEQGILALITLSANDAATALGEFLGGGSEDRFAQMMTAKARALGMTRTIYRNANGLPNTAQMTTARDQARLGIALRQHFPQYYSYFSTRSFRFGNRIINSHNRLVGSVRGVDGIKTGYTRAAGFNLVSSVQVDGKSIVGVVLGGTSTPARDSQMRNLIATYLPKASGRDGNSNLIARTAPEVPVAPAAPAAPVAVAAVAQNVYLPNSGPVPDARYKTAQPEVAQEVAYAETSPSKSANPLLSRQVARQVVQAKVASVAIPTPAPANVPAVKQQDDAVEQGDASVDKVTTASTAAARASSTTGWVVQVGVSSDKQMAMDLLNSAKNKGGKALQSAKPFTVAFGEGGDQVYRARFGGFDDQRSAVNACNALRKAGIKCWASMQ